MGDGVERRDIVVVGTHGFHAGVPLGDWHIARALARFHRVLWVDPPTSPVAPLRGAASGSMYRWRPTKVGESLFVGTPVVHSGRLRSRDDSLLRYLLAIQVRRWLRQLGMSDLLVLLFTSRYGALPGVPRDALVVWMKDRDWADGGPHGEWLRRRHEDVVRAANVVVGVPDALVADCKAIGGEATRIPNGCDVEHYSTPRPVPTALAGLPHPRVVFSGAWNGRVDRALVADVVARLPNASFIVLGRATEPLPDSVNVHALPAVPYADLPAYLQASDIGIVPYRSGTFNDASCPLKVYEYLAAGLPVVVSGIPTPDLPNALIREASDAAAFAAAVDDLARRDLRQACRAEATKHSWAARARLLMELAESAEPARTLREQSG